MRINKKNKILDFIVQLSFSGLPSRDHNKNKNSSPEREEERKKEGRTQRPRLSLFWSLPRPRLSFLARLAAQTCAACLTDLCVGQASSSSSVRPLEDWPFAANIPCSAELTPHSCAWTHSASHPTLRPRSRCCGTAQPMPNSHTPCGSRRQRPTMLRVWLACCANRRVAIW